MTAVLNFFFRSKAWYGNTGALQSLPVVSLFPKRNPPSVWRVRSSTAAAED